MKLTDKEAARLFNSLQRLARRHEAVQKIRARAKWSRCEHYFDDPFKMACKRRFIEPHCDSCADVYRAKFQLREAKAALSRAITSLVKVFDDGDYVARAAMDEVPE